jgi:integrase
VQGAVSAGDGTAPEPNRGTVAWVVGAVCDQAGLHWAGAHRLRHTPRPSWTKGVDIRTIALWLGHETAQTKLESLRFVEYLIGATALSKANAAGRARAQRSRVLDVQEVMGNSA